MPCKKSVHRKRERERESEKENHSRAVVFYGFFRGRSCGTHRSFSRASSRTKSISRTFSRVRASRSMLTERRNKKWLTVLLDFLSLSGQKRLARLSKKKERKTTIVKFPHFNVYGIIVAKCITKYIARNRESARRRAETVTSSVPNALSS